MPLKGLERGPPAGAMSKATVGPVRMPDARGTSSRTSIRCQAARAPLQGAGGGREGGEVDDLKAILNTYILTSINGLRPAELYLGAIFLSGSRRKCVVTSSGGSGKVASPGYFVHEVGFQSEANERVNSEHSRGARKRDRPGAMMARSRAREKQVSEQ